ncbi:MAG: 5-formyltetrahydrofolate cyclo-ligase, partial [Coxiellaceae bacterium]|nr:5-formyltetrahydrofolate cyclo-ligase [Coxiellaceae bacterium]
PEFIDSKTLAFYLPQENELDTTPSMRCAWDLKKHVYLPVTAKDDKHLAFYSYQQEDQLLNNHFNILEPDTKTQTKIDREALDIIFLPLVGFDTHGNRLGRGAGYYDHTLDFIKTTEKKRPLLIGLAYEFQKIPNIEPSKWDVPMDKVITEEAIY